MPLPVPCRVLVVDDHPDAAGSLAQVIEMQGHQAVYLTDPTTVEHVVKDFEPHIVLLDITMPGIDGWTLGRKLRELEGGKTLKLVAVTALSHPEARAASRKAGFDAHLAKPIDPKMIPALLDQFFSEEIRLR